MSKKSTGSDAVENPRILIVDDTESVRSYLAELLEKDGWNVDTADSGRHALELLRAGANPDVVLLDLGMQGLDGKQTLTRIRKRHPDVPVVMMSVVGAASTIVEVMRLGADDYLTKPFDADSLESVLQRILERRRATSPSPVQAPVDGDGVLWQSAALSAIRETIDQISDTDVTVLIQGESGVGKEIVARRVHERSNRSSAPFVKVNCAALPSGLLESELFGYETGAFTGANSRKPGRFELADKGTIFLDEIGEVSPKLQAKLLQVLQDGEFTRLGGNKEVHVDVRVVCATNRPLQEMVSQGRFREDLFFRINVVNIYIPPLRERRDEIAGLTAAFLQRYSACYERPSRSLSPGLEKAFEAYAFPGNVRELENLVKRVVILESEESVLASVSAAADDRRDAGAALMELIQEIEQTAGELPLKEVGRRVAMEAERDAIQQVLTQTDWNRKQAAKSLNVSYKTLLQKIRECGLEPNT